ncbi:MAG: hypothetical protein QE493_04140 [Verrucomicrobiae bacterium]|jgi:hypothetical protein|nr:hypothetical protein [Verrucomicrobiae bacterium]
MSDSSLKISSSAISPNTSTESIEDEGSLSSSGSWDHFIEQVSSSESSLSSLTSGEGRSTPYPVSETSPNLENHTIEQLSEPSSASPATIAEKSAKLAPSSAKLNPNELMEKALRVFLLQQQGDVVSARKEANQTKVNYETILQQHEQEYNQIRESHHQAPELPSLELWDQRNYFDKCSFYSSPDHNAPKILPLLQRDACREIIMLQNNILIATDILLSPAPEERARIQITLDNNDNLNLKLPAGKNFITHVQNVILKLRGLTTHCTGLFTTAREAIIHHQENPLQVPHKALSQIKSQLMQIDCYAVAGNIIQENIIKHQDAVSLLQEVREQRRAAGEQVPQHFTERLEQPIHKTISNAKLSINFAFACQHAVDDLLATIPQEADLNPQQVEDIKEYSKASALFKMSSIFFLESANSYSQGDPTSARMNNLKASGFQCAGLSSKFRLDSFNLANMGDAPYFFENIHERALAAVNPLQQITNAMPVPQKNVLLNQCEIALTRLHGEQCNLLVAYFLPHVPENEIAGAIQQLLTPQNPII